MSRADEPLTLGDLEARAVAALDPAWAGYFAGGAGGEHTLRANAEAFARWELRQRVLAGLSSVSTATEVLGIPVAHPIVVAPVAYQRMAHPDGEEGMAAAAAAVGGAMCLSTFATAEPAAVVAGAPGGVRFLQLYVLADRGISDELVAQAVALGFQAIVLTVDFPILGPRDRERRVQWRFPDEDLPAMRYARTRGLGETDLGSIDRTLDTAYLERLVATAGVPVVVKGVMEADDARRCVASGATGVVVSNHGGRQLDRVPATLDVLAEVVAAVGDDAEVWVDGGVRRGTDVLTCLALGARAVLVGRQPLWGLVLGGSVGARTVLELLREELEIAMTLTGCGSISAVGPQILRPASPWQDATR